MTCRANQTVLKTLCPVSSTDMDAWNQKSRTKSRLDSHLCDSNIENVLIYLLSEVGLHYVTDVTKHHGFPSNTHTRRSV